MNNYTVKKPPHVGIPFEDVVNGETYAFTFNPKDVLTPQDGVSNLVIFAKSMNALCLTMYKNYNADLKLYIEYSKLGRLHVHGYIKINDKFALYDSGLHYLMLRGTFCMKYMETKDDKDKWEDYCLKQEKEITANLLTHNISHPITKDTTTPLVKIKRDKGSHHKSIEAYF